MKEIAVNEVNIFPLTMEVCTSPIIRALTTNISLNKMSTKAHKHFKYDNKN